MVIPPCFVGFGNKKSAPDKSKYAAETLPLFVYYWCVVITSWWVSGLKKQSLHRERSRQAKQTFLRSISRGSCSKMDSMVKVMGWPIAHAMRRRVQAACSDNSGVYAIGSHLLSK
jgi:hypothetical protein